MRVLLALLLSLALAASVAAQSYINGHLTVEGGTNACTATGTGNAYGCTLTYPLKGYKNLQCFTMKANHSNTGPATINIQGHGPKAIRKWVAGSLVDVGAGDITLGQLVELCYDGTVMQVASGTGGAGGGSVVAGDGLEDTGSALVTQSQEARFLRDGGTTDLTCGAGNQGKLQTMDDGTLQGCDGAATSVLRRYVPLPAPFVFNLTASTCTSDANGGALTINGSNQIVCSADDGGAGGPGDITAVGNIASGAAGTAATPLSQLWWSTGAAPATPAANTSVLYLDTTSENVSAKNDLGTVTHLVQTKAVVANEFVTGIAASGSVSGRRPVLTDLTDAATVVTLTAAQSVEEKLLVPREQQLAAASGTVTPNVNTDDLWYRYDVSGGLTFQAPIATAPNPHHGQILRIVLRSATPQPLTWAAAYSAEFGLPLPTSTTGDGVRFDALAFFWNSTSGKWGLISTTTPTATWPPKQVDVQANPASLTPNVDTTDEVAITALAQALTLNVPVWTVTPSNARYLALHIFSAAAQPLTWNTGTNGYSAESGIALPTTTTAGVRMILVLRWNLATSKWALVGSSVPTEPAPVTVVTLTCNGTTDNSPTLQAAITAGITSNRGSSLLLARTGTGSCRLNSTVTIANVMWMILDANNLTFSWGGNSTTPMFLFSDARDTVFTRFHVETGPSAPLAVVFQYENGAGTTVTPTNNVLSDGTIDCITTNGCTTGVLYALGAGGDANNDLNTIENVQINNPTAECIKIVHSQSKSNVFDKVTCAGNNLTGNFVETTAGSFVCRSCAGGNTTGPLFFLGNATDTIAIVEGNFEGGTRLLETGGPSGAPFPVTIRNSRWSNHELHADNRAVVFRFPGPLVLEGNLIQPETENRATEIYFGPGPGFGGFVSLGNYFASTRTNPYTGVQPDVSFGNVIDRNDTNGVVKLPAIGGGSGGGTGTVQLSVVGVKFATTNTAVLDVSETNDRLLFDAATAECGIWQGAMPTEYASAPVAHLQYTMTSATSGGVALDFRVMAVTAGDSADVNTESYDAANTCTDTVPGTAGFLKRIACPLTNNDGVTGRDLVKVQVCRNVANASDTASGDLEALTLVLEYSK